MKDMKWAVFTVEAVTLLVLGAAYVISGRLLGAAILIGLAAVAAGCIWAFWPAGCAVPRARAAESPRRAGSSPPPRH